MAKNLSVWTQTAIASSVCAIVSHMLPATLAVT